MKALRTWSFRPPTNHHVTQHPDGAAKAAFFNLEQQSSIIIALLTVWDSFLLVFFMV